MTPAELLRVGLPWLGTYLLHSTLLLGAVWLLTRLRRFAEPHVAERLWRTGLIGGVLTTSLQLGFVHRPLLGSWTLSERETARLEEEAQILPRLLRAPFVESRGPTRGSEPVRDDGPLDRAAPEDAPTQRSTSLDATAEPPLADRLSDRFASLFADAEPLAASDVERDAPEDVVEEQVPAVLASVTPSEDARASATTMRREPRATPPTNEDAHDESEALSIPSALASLERRLPWRSGLLLLWTAVAALGVAGILWAASRLRHLLSDRREVTAGPLREELDQLIAEAGLRRRVRLFASERLVSPITYGWIAPRICVPSRVLTELSASQQASLLAHELAHASRRDPLWFSLYALLERLLFFQPLNRLARRHLQDAAELLCDEWAVRWTGGRLALASCLTEIAQWIVGRRSHVPGAHGVPGMASRPSQLGRRVERLLDEEPRREARGAGRWWMTSTAGGLGVVVLAVPGISAAPAFVRATPASAVSTPVSAPALTPAPTFARAAPTRVEPVPEAPPLVSGPEGLEEAGGTVRRMARELSTDSERLSDGLELLTAELEALRQEMGERGRYPQLERSLLSLEARIRSLHERRERLHALLTLLSSSLDSDPNAAPRAGTPSED